MIKDDQPEERVMLQTRTKNILFKIVCNDVKLRTGGRATEKKIRRWYRTISS